MSQFRIGVSFPEHRSSRADAAWGSIRLSVDDQPVWDDQGKGIMWTLIEFLEFLGRSWISLVSDETWPVAEALSWPEDLLRHAEDIWLDANDERVEREEAQLHRFLSHHDLAWAFDGLFLPSVVVVRHGNSALVVVTDENLKCIYPLRTVLGELERTGDAIAEYLGATEEPRAAAAVRRWRRRDDVGLVDAIGARTGLSTVEIQRISNELGESERVWGQSVSAVLEGDSPILAAARMSVGIITHDDRIRVLRAIRSLPRRSFARLDDLRRQLRIESFDTRRPFELGYDAANQVRSILDVGEMDRLDPAQVLRDLDVDLAHTINLPDVPLDAVAIWGSDVGPSILVNTAERSRASHEHGLRSTYAHELCHLLLDRDDALPVGELLGGRVPILPEKRARAFAAELLLPRASAAAVVRSSDTVFSALRELPRRFGVSEELAAWQVENAPGLGDLLEDWQPVFNAGIRR